MIPEMGINHEEVRDRKEMVDAHTRTGARIKHQTHIVEDEMSGAAKKSYREMQMFLFMRL